MIPSFMDQLLRELVPGAGPLTHIARVTGGDISEAYALETGTRTFFCKVQDAGRGKAMFEAEVRGLDVLRAYFPRVPAALGTGVWQGRACLVLEWLAEGPPRADRWARLGEGLARLHLGVAPEGSPAFGFPEDNFIGSLPQDNHPEKDWPTFYVRRRLLPLLRQGVTRGLFISKTLDQVGVLEGRLGSLFPPTLPALLHGDLWSGNTRLGPDGDLWIFDPAVYRGHREMDLGMTRLFGGFPPAFYEAYAYHYPPDPGWAERVDLCQLYPLLVHALLFGGSYVRQCGAILDAYTG